MTANGEGLRENALSVVFDAEAEFPYVIDPMMAPLAQQALVSDETIGTYDPTIDGSLGVDGSLALSRDATRTLLLRLDRLYDVQKDACSGGKNSLGFINKLTFDISITALSNDPFWLRHPALKVARKRAEGQRGSAKSLLSRLGIHSS